MFTLSPSSIRVRPEAQDVGTAEAHWHQPYQCAKGRRTVQRTANGLKDERSSEAARSTAFEEGSLLRDLTHGKGNGLIVLLHGPPGVGKTLTAEAFATLSGRPLHPVTMFDLDTSPAAVETNMNKIFQLATQWKALLLFDEADVFLEKRSLRNLERNSLVSVLLRILEYFSGILFLTTNRVKTFNEAFQSRIHIAVQFKELNDKQKGPLLELLA